MRTAITRWKGVWEVPLPAAMHFVCYKCESVRIVISTAIAEVSEVMLKKS